jgi:tetratricopeptide (TPR) repeat protein
MSNVFFALGSQAIAEKQYEKAIKMFERVVELEKLVYPAYFNLTASYEYLARSPETPYSEEKGYLEKAKETLEMAKATFYRGRDIGDDARNKNGNFQQVNQYLSRIELQMTTSREQADSIKEQAINENSFDSYNSYANFVYQGRQDVDATLWAKLEALKRATTKDQKLAVTKEISILYANVGNTPMSLSTLKNAMTSITGLTRVDIEGIEFDLASTYLNLKQFNEARSIYIKYTNEISQNGAFAIYALGHIALEEGNTEEALIIYNGFDKMLPLTATNQNVAALKQEIDNRKAQILNYLNQPR